MADRWEYQYINIPREQTDRVAVLNSYGTAGWELVTAALITSSPTQPDFIHFIFKRRVTSPTD